MIAATLGTSHPEFGAGSATLPRWQQLLADAIVDPAELLDILQLDPKLLPAAKLAAERFPLRVPRGFVARMRVGDIDDPLLRQVLPIQAEMAVATGYTFDPVGDMASRAAPGLLHKYRGRALLIVTGACGVHCRYCFRRHFPYGEETATRSQWANTIDYLRSDSSIVEVILSGGDPLSLADARLSEISRDLETIPHIRRLRIHTRQPIVLPERVDAGFCEWLAQVRLQKIVVLHANHANEIDAGVRAACHRLAACGATLLNQSVLLKGINDTVASLAALSERLFASGALPYYLHLLDRVQGAAHYAVAESDACAMAHELAAQLPGYLVPKLVRESAGEPAKSPVFANLGDAS